MAGAGVGLERRRRGGGDVLTVVLYPAISCVIMRRGGGGGEGGNGVGVLSLFFTTINIWGVFSRGVSSGVSFEGS